MEARFKFRCWIANTMLDVREVDIYLGGGKLQKIGGEDCCGNYRYFKDYFDSKFNSFVLMQCTGLKDKNGRLIYEGDIVRYYYKKSKTNPEKPQATDNFIVKWCERGNWTLYTTDNKESLILGICLKEIEIIGNIYENPELLKEVIE